MTPQEQLEQAAKDHRAVKGISMLSTTSYHSFIAGGLKGMEIQKEIDRQEIERLTAKIKNLETLRHDC